MGGGFGGDVRSPRAHTSTHPHTSQGHTTKWCEAPAEPGKAQHRPRTAHTNVPHFHIHPHPFRVYMAKWCETLVAVKLLLNTGVNLDDMEAAAELAISLSNPILHNLQQEAALMAALRCACCARCVLCMCRALPCGRAGGILAAAEVVVCAVVMLQ